MKIISGKEIAAKIRDALKENNEQENICPCLAVILVGDDKESMVYVNLKDKAAASIAGKAEIVKLPHETTKEQLMQKIYELNANNDIHGIILQLPLPEHLEDAQDDFLAAIQPEKDVDGFNPINRGKLLEGEPAFISCAAIACTDIIDSYIKHVAGKKALLIGESFDLIMPLALILIRKGCTVTVLPEYDPVYVEGTDLLVVEKGNANEVKGEHLHSDMLIIDAGFHWSEESGTCGNIDKESVAGIEGYLLPVPGGMGPMLIAKLMDNVSRAARKR